MKYKFYLFFDPLDYEDDVFLYNRKIKDFFEENLKDVQYEIESTDCGNELETKDYDVLFFDWGGLSIGNSMLEHFTFRILDIAENNPSKKIVIVSEMTKYAFDDAKDELGKDLPFNIYFGTDKLFEDIKKENGK